MFSASGERITDKEIPGCRNWIWWDEDLLRETFVQSKNERHPTENRRRHSMRIAKYGKDKYYDNIEGSILMIADLEGDWREEVITALPGEIRIYKTGIPARDKRITLMQDPVYRSYVLQRSQGYEQAPVPGYYLGE